MLNISNEKITQQIAEENLSTLIAVEQKNSSRVLRKILSYAILISIIILFLPWTQNIKTAGRVSTLKPNQKPQTINSIIGGQINSWYVQEGDFVQKGDTILRVTETKDAYFDTLLLPRTKEQLAFKKQSILNYENKIKAQKERLDILTQLKNLKLKQTNIKIEQTKLKAQNDSIYYTAKANDYNIALKQYKRTDSLYKQGLKSLTSLETKSAKLQQAKAYQTEAKNKWMNSLNALINLKLELNNIINKYNADYNKLQSEIFSTTSAKLEAENQVSKLENKYSNYQFRNNQYYILAPINGYITKILKSGIGVTLKAGQEILTIMPQDYDLAVEIYVKPIDLPLIHLNEKVRIQFDGWPAIIFSGWPTASHGTYGGTIYAIDQYISANGKYRVLVKPDPNDFEWPKALRYGGGTSTLIMLNDVPIWYELWRNINGFPPEYYEPITEKKAKK